MEKDGANKDSRSGFSLKKIILIIFIIFAVLVIIFIIFLVFFGKASNNTENIKGLNIKSVSISSDGKEANILLKENQDAIPTKIVFRDDNGNKYTYEIEDSSQEIYTIFADDINIKNFNNINNVFAVLKKETSETSASETSTSREDENIGDSGTGDHNLQVFVDVTNKTCKYNQDCNDNINCTIDRCIDGKCVNNIDEEFCDNSNICDGFETCNKTTGCMHGIYLNCTDNNECTSDNCNPSGGCYNTPLNTGVACSLGYCNNGLCSGCISNDQCIDTDSCTVDVCVNRTCSHTPRACQSGQVCFNGVCISSDPCSSITTCSAYSSQTACTNDLCNLNCEWKNNICVIKQTTDPCLTKNCNDNNACTDDSCLEGNCINTPKTCPSGQVCSNGICIVSNPCSGVTSCSSYSSQTTCLADSCNLGCEWKNNACTVIISQNSSHYSYGTGGQTGEVHKTFTSSDGMSSTYDINVPSDISSEKAYGLLIHFHGDYGAYYDKFLPALVQTGKRYNLMRLMMKAPPPQPFIYGPSWWSPSSKCYKEAKWVNELIQNEIFKKYNIDKTQVYFTGESGGSEFLASYFIPQYGKYYNSGALFLCGGATYEPKALSQIPQETRDSFRLYYYYGSSDYLLSGITNGIKNYKNLGMKYLTDEKIQGLGHCTSYPEGTPAVVDKKVGNIIHN